MASNHRGKGTGIGTVWALGWAFGFRVKRKENEERGKKTEVTGIETPSLVICMSLEKRKKGTTSDDDNVMMK